jgi:hypothetical protein
VSLASFLKFAVENAPLLIGPLRDLVGLWADRHGIDKTKLLGVLDGTIREDVAKVDNEIDALIGKEFR